MEKQATIPRSPPMEEEIDVSTEMVLDDEDDEHDMTTGIDDMQMKQEKMDAAMLLNGDFSVENEVTISSRKYQGRPPTARKMQYTNPDGTPRFQRNTNITGETLNLKSSDLSIPNKAAHFLYFRCYEEHEVQKEFPLTIDEHRKGPQNFLVEPRVGLKNTDYYIDSYLWNRGKSTSSKKKIFVEIEGSHVKTSRRACDTAHYVLNWYYSNMENRICKKVCWLETAIDNMRASPVLVQYHVNYLSEHPIELRKTPKLYSDTRSVAQELLRSDSPLQTVQRFVETGETDPREIINKKQAYEMRRYVMANARKRVGGQRPKYDEHGMYYENDDMFEEIFFNEAGEPINFRNGRDTNPELIRVAQMAVRMEGRRIEHRIARMLDMRIGPAKNQAEVLTEWITALERVNPADPGFVIHNVIGSMRKQLEDLLAEHPGDYLDPAPSTSEGIKRMKMMEDEEDVGEEEVHHHHVVEEEEEEVEIRRAGGRKTRFEGERYIFDGQEYVEEEVITEEMEEEVVVPRTPDRVVVSNGESTSEPRDDSFFFRRPAAGAAAGNPRVVGGGGGSGERGGRRVVVVDADGAGPSGGPSSRNADE